VGARLTAHCIARAREEGAGYLALHTAPAMLAARRVYERLGFRRAPEHDFDPAAHYAGAADPAEPPWGLAYLLRLDGS
jgi:ribosomal protein S18 acetylase RimI-like enzyme